MKQYPPCGSWTRTFIQGYIEIHLHTDKQPIFLKIITMLLCIILANIIMEQRMITLNYGLI